MIMARCSWCPNEINHVGLWQGRVCTFNGSGATNKVGDGLTCVGAGETVTTGVVVVAKATAAHNKRLKTFKDMILLELPRQCVPLLSTHLSSAEKLTNQSS
jgi:hypothetical protein